MIKSRKDLKFYLKEDAKANFLEGVSWINYIIRLFVGSESAHVYQYLKCLRHCEYHLNNTGLYHQIFYWLFKIRLHRLGFKFK